MVAIIHSGQSFRRAVHYNENKVIEKKAHCLSAINYPKTVESLTVQQKINRLHKQAALNEKVKVNCVHISLNFDPSEKLSAQKMQKIAAAYMEKIGFGEQPCLVYQHHDAGHPHVHIVTTNIMADGKRIPLHNLGRDKSEPARKHIEQEFRLVPAGGKQLRGDDELQPVKIQYGRIDTKRAISAVVNKIVSQYKFASLEELNAVLKLYNVKAERGEPESRTYDRGGLLYRVLDENGNTVGTPIKASSIYSKPTLKTLEKKYAVNEAVRKPHRQRVKTTIDWMFHDRKMTIEAFAKALEKESVQVILRSNATGRIYGITYIDHLTKCVFNGSDLGKSYTAKGILERCANENAQQQFTVPALAVKNEPIEQEPRLKLFTFDRWHAGHGDTKAMPPELQPQSRKKKRRRPKL